MDELKPEHADSVAFVNSQKGRILLLNQGHYFVREKKLPNNKVYWRCSYYTTPTRCHARLHTLNGRILYRSAHNHVANMKKSERLRTKLMLVESVDDYEQLQERELLQQLHMTSDLQLPMQTQASAQPSVEYLWEATELYEEDTQVTMEMNTSSVFAQISNSEDVS